MPKKFDYTTQARKMAFRFPVFTRISIQINFWIISFTFLLAIIHLSALSLSVTFGFPAQTSFLPSLIMACISGIIYGIILGYVDIFLEKGFLKNLSMGLMILFRTLIYFAIVILVMIFTRNVVWKMLIVPHFFGGASPFENNLVWHYFFYIMLIFTPLMATLMSFINLMNQKFGPGVLMPLLFGKYKNPREEERIFMFMDLKSSTTHAEKLGHIKYSALIRDSFMDINQVLAKHNAEVYQYVGDEIVVSWPINEGMRGLACVEFFFSTQEQFSQRHNYYLENYGFVPQFKAGLHMGMVTAVEVGEVKRDIAYHGDTLNTAARIQSICNQYDKAFLVSQDIKEISDMENKYNLESIGNIILKGKDIPVGVYSIDTRKVS
jgi:adenylate cyclase